MLSSDGKLNIAKPPGHYSSYKSTTTGKLSYRIVSSSYLILLIYYLQVYEAVPIEMRRESHQEMTATDQPRRQLTVTILNTHGRGLCCSMDKNGYYNLYNGNPGESSNLLATGGEFDFYDIILLIMTADGTLHDSHEYFSSINSAFPSISPAGETIVDEIDEENTKETPGAKIEVIKPKEEPEEAEAMYIKEHQHQQQQADAFVGTNASQNSSVSGSLILTTDNDQAALTFSSGVSTQQEDMGVEVEDESKISSTSKLESSGFDYTKSNIYHDRPDSNNRSTASKPALIGILCLSLVLGTALIFISQRRKASKDYMHHEDQDSSSICSDDFVDHDTIDVDAFRPPPIPRNGLSSLRSWPRHPSNRASPGDDDNSISSGSSNSYRSYTSKQSYRSNCSHMSNRSHMSNQNNRSDKSHPRTGTSGSSITSRTIDSQSNMLLTRRHSAEHAQYKHGTDKICFTGSDSYRRSVSYPGANSTCDAEGYSDDNVNKMVHSALNNAISLFDDGSDDNMRTDVNSILQRFDAEVDDGVIT